MRHDRTLGVAAESGLLAVTVAAVLGMSRLFDGGGWLGPLTASALAAHATVAITRRRGFGVPSATLVCAAAAVLVITVTQYASTTAAWLPTGDTWSAMRRDLDEAWLLYREVVAPAPVVPGFVLASSVAVWFVAFVADWAAFRLWVPFEATLPAGTLFLFTALLGTDRGRGWAIALFAASVLGFLLLHRLARQDGSSHWVADRRAEGHRSLLVAGGVLGLVAVVAGTVLGPSVPGAGSPGIIDPDSFTDNDRARVTISPLVDIRTRLVDQSSVEVFRVRSPRESYWRLTSLDRFDGRRWSSSGRYREADGRLPSEVDADIEVETFEQTVSIKALAAIWLPSAYEPRAVASRTVDVLYEPESATLIVDQDTPTSDGIVYQVMSESPRITPADLEGSAGPVPSEIRDRYLALPEDFSPAVAELAAQITATAGTPYGAARALQDHLRTFTYDLEVENGHGTDDLERFLFETKRGYCEQFAGAFAAMARAVGLPARVAVGFTQGETEPTDPTLYIVRGQHAHAWPEVYFAGAGWVAFEPTPGRGMPFADSYTGVPPAQASSEDPTVATTSPPTTAGGSIPSLPDASSSPRVREDELATLGGGIPNASGEDPGWSVRRVLRGPVRTIAIGTGIGAAAYVVLVPTALFVLRHRRRRRAVDDPVARVQLAWTETAEDARLAGYEPHPSDTFAEAAARLGAQLPEVADAADTLARQLEIATYSAAGGDGVSVDEVDAARVELADAVRVATSRPARILRWFDPRPWIERARAQGAAHRHITTTVRADLEVERELVGSGDRG